MAGLSSTLFDSASIDLTGDHSASAKSGSTISGRALSDVAHGSGAGLRYLEVEVTALRSSGNRWWGVGFTDSSGSLTRWIGAGADQSLYLGATIATGLNIYINGNNQGGAGSSLQGVGARLLLWLDPATRRVWVSSRPRNGFLIGASYAARPDLGTQQSWTVPGTGALRFAVTPGFGSGDDRNTVRVRTRHSEMLNGELYGALPWDARSVTLTGGLNPAHVSVGDTLRWAWFDHSSPHELSSAATSRGSTTVLAGHTYSITATTSLDAGQVGSLVLMRSDGTVVAARSHYCPVTAP